jgi:hypothetical protein
MTSVGVNPCGESVSLPLLGGGTFLTQYRQESDQQEQHVYDREYEHLSSLPDTTDWIMKPIKIE